MTGWGMKYNGTLDIIGSGLGNTPKNGHAPAISAIPLFFKYALRWLTRINPAANLDYSHHPLYRR